MSDRQMAMSVDLKGLNSEHQKGMWVVQRAIQWERLWGYLKVTSLEF